MGLVRYLGGKGRLAKQLLSHMLPHRRVGQLWVEPFCGMGGMLKHVANPRLACDINPYLIEFLCAARDGWEPPEELTEAEYRRIREFPDENRPLTAFAGFGCSFGGKWFGGYARDAQGTNYAAQSARGVRKWAPRLAGAFIRCEDYHQLVLTPASFVYCDPPYAGTTTYGGTDSFDSEMFAAWTNRIAKQGHTVFVSELNALSPNWECVFEKERAMNTSLRGEAPRKFDRLYRVHPASGVGAA